MDAFKTLQTQMPEMALMTKDQLHKMVFWSGAGLKWCKLQIGIAEDVGGLQDQVDTWLLEGQSLSEFNMKGTARLGEIAKEEPQEHVLKTSSGREGTRGAEIKPTGKPPKWKRLGFKSLQAMNEAQFLANHPTETQEVLDDAKKENDFASKGAVKSKVRAKKMEERAEKAEAAAARDQAETDKKTDIKNPKIVKEYLDATSTFKEVLKRAIVGAKNERFDPAAWNFVYNRHTQIKEMMEELEKLI